MKLFLPCLSIFPIVPYYFCESYPMFPFIPDYFPYYFFCRGTARDRKKTLFVKSVFFMVSLLSKGILPYFPITSKYFFEKPTLFPYYFQVLLRESYPISLLVPSNFSESYPSSSYPISLLIPSISSRILPYFPIISHYFFENPTLFPYHFPVLLPNIFFRGFRH